MWRFIEPNKPIRASDDFLDGIDDRYVIDAKLDGWRCEIGKFNGKIQANYRSSNECLLPPSIIETISFIPEGTALDCEWINKTRIKALNTEYGWNLPLVDKLSVIDVTWVGGRYNGGMTQRDRCKLPVYLKFQRVSVDDIFNDDVTAFQAPCYIGDDPHSFYEEQKRHQISEGVVIKKLKGNLKNTWYKVKYRG